MHFYKGSTSPFLKGTSSLKFVRLTCYLNVEVNVRSCLGLAFNLDLFIFSEATIFLQKFKYHAMLTDYFKTIASKHYNITYLATSIPVVNVNAYACVIDDQNCNL